MTELLMIGFAEFFYDVLVPLGMLLILVVTPWVLLRWAYRVGRAIAAQDAATEFPRDGQWWLAVNDLDGGRVAQRGLIKITYLSGLIQGAQFLGFFTAGEAVRLSRETFKDELLDAVSAEKAITDGLLARGVYKDTAAKRYWERLTPWQVADGLDKFYEDFRNRRIGIFLAV